MLGLSVSVIEYGSGSTSLCWDSPPWSTMVTVMTAVPLPVIVMTTPLTATVVVGGVVVVVVGGAVVVVAGAVVVVGGAVEAVVAFVAVAAVVTVVELPEGLCFFDEPATARMTTATNTIARMMNQGLLYQGRFGPDWALWAGPRFGVPGTGLAVEAAIAGGGGGGGGDE